MSDVVFDVRQMGIKPAICLSLVKKAILNWLLKGATDIQTIK